MDYKLDYIARLFRKIAHKRFESYAIQRIWNKLSDDRIHFVTQQYFQRSDGSFALADLFFPQLNIIVEIDEAQHNIEDNKILDAIRSKEITAVSGAVIRRIPICKDPADIDPSNDAKYTLSGINKQIDEVVDFIKEAIADKEKNGSFHIWSGDFLSVEYHKEKGYFSANEFDYVRSIDDAAAIFGIKVKHRGFLRPGGFNLPDEDNTIVWCPASINKIWTNTLSSDRFFIRERKNEATDEERRVIKTNALNTKEKRIVFFKEKDVLGFNFYRFVGVFEIDEERTNQEDCRVWIRKSDRYDIK
ncbi:MAG: hypothetical protein IKH93_00815 [Bacteroidales bacterium]|nr:hypothetical protein [Bacteroidales bacterium]